MRYFVVIKKYYYQVVGEMVVVDLFVSKCTMQKVGARVHGAGVPGGVSAAGAVADAILCAGAPARGPGRRLHHRHHAHTARYASTD